MDSIILTKEEHRFFTNAWRGRLPYGTTYKKGEIYQVGMEIYKDYPSLQNVLKRVLLD